MDTNKMNGIVAKYMGIGFGGLIAQLMHKVTEDLYCMQKQRLERLHTKEENAMHSNTWTELLRKKEILRQDEVALLSRQWRQTVDSALEKKREIIEAENGGEA